MTLSPRFRRSSPAVLIAVLLLGGSREIALTQSPRLEYRVVFAKAHELERRLDEVGQQGFSCAMVARPDSDARVPGVVVVMSRAVHTTTPAPVTHRVVRGGYRGTDLPSLLNRATTDGYRLCGVAFDEGIPSIIGVMSREPGAWTYGAEVLSDNRGALGRLTAAGKDGFVPVAVSPIDNNRVPAMRNWVVVTEQPATTRRKIDVTVRSGSGPDSLQKSLAEQSSQGYRIALAWKESNDVVVMMTREAGASTASVSYAVEAMPSAAMHSVSRPYIFDAPYLSNQRLVITEQSGLASNEAVEDALPPITLLGTAAPGPLGTLSDHLSRLQDYFVGSVTVRRGPRDELVLRTIMTRR
jgi:hypothetical protein